MTGPPHDGVSQPDDAGSEWGLLCRTVGAGTGPVAWDQVDADRLVALADAHGVVPQFADGLADAETPDEIASQFLRRHREHASSALRLTGALHDVLDDVGVRALPYKGPVLSTVAYGSVSARQYVDLDVLVAPNAFAEACEALRSMGYTEVDRLEALGEVVFERDGVTIDLHRRILPRYVPASLPFDAVWDRRTDVEVGGRCVPALEPADRLAVLGVHGTKHCWYRLAWVCDVAALLALEDGQQERALDRANDLRCRRHFLVGCWLANTLLDTALDDAVGTAIEADPVVGSLGEKLRDRLRTPPVASPSNRDQFAVGWRAQTRRRDRLLFAARLATIPSADDLESVPLPDPLHPLYRIVRPARLAVRAGRTAASRFR